jgi:hypothetical protein
VVHEAREDDETVNGAVDASLIDEMLKLSPIERLRLNDRMAALASKLQEAFSGRRADG